jgi:hypothetical protein
VRPVSNILLPQFADDGSRLRFPQPTLGRDAPAVGPALHRIEIDLLRAVVDQKVRALGAGDQT